MTDKEWQSLQDEIVSRIDNIFSSRPTWSRWPNMEAEMLQSIQQAIRDEIYLVRARKKKSCSKAQMSR